MPGKKAPSPQAPPFPVARDQLFNKFLAGKPIDESDESHAIEVRDLILRNERLRHGVLDKPEYWDRVDSQTLQAMSQWETDDPRLQAIQNVFHRFAKDRNVDALKLLIASSEMKQKEISERQSKVAKTPRQGSAINQIIERIANRRPHITALELSIEMENEMQNYDSPIVGIEDDAIVLADGIRISIGALGIRLSRIKKKLKIIS